MAGLTEKLGKVVAFAQNAGLIVRDAEANKMWETVYPPLYEARPGLAGAVLNRAEAQVLRLSLLYALINCSRVIYVEHLKAALAVWDYCEASANYIFGTKTGNPVADRIIEALKESVSGYREIPSGASHNAVTLFKAT
jgi:hypothetical protein